MVTLYLNSSIALLQLIGFVVETRGAWITLHGDQVWKHIHVPSLEGISKKLRNDVLRVFNKVSKLDAENLLDRLKNMSPIQKEIDEVSLELLGMSSWKDRLSDIHIAIRDELQAMLEILDRSRKPAKKAKKIMKEETSKGRQLVLDTEKCFINFQQAILLEPLLWVQVLHLQGKSL
jgi:hypothetical protein